MTEANIWNNLDTPSLKLRKELIQELKGFLDDGGNVDLAKTVVSIIFRALFIWNDWDSNHLIESTIAEFTKNPENVAFRTEFYNNFLVIVQKQIFDPKYPTKVASIVHRVFRWSVVFLKHTSQDQIQTLGKFPNYAAAQAALLESLKEETHFEKKITGIFSSSLLPKHPWLVPEYMKVAEANPPKNLYLLQLLLSYLTAPRSAGIVEQYKGVLLKIYDDHILSATTKLTPFARESLNGLVGVLQHEEVKTRILPTITRLFKRSAALVIPQLLAVLQALKLDLSRYHKELLPFIIDELRGTEDERRANAISLVRVLASKSSDASVLKETLADLFTHVLGKAKQGAIPLWNVRASFLQAIRGVSYSTEVDGKQLNQLADFVLANIAELMKTESHDSAKQQAIEVVGRWAAVCSDVPANIVKFLQAGVSLDLKDRKFEPVVNAYLKAIAALANAPAFTKWQSLFAGSTADIGRHLKQATAAPAQLRLVGLLSAAIAIRLAPADDKLWLELLQNKSFITDLDLVSKSSLEEVEAHLEILTSLHQTQLLTKHGGRLVALLASVVRLALLPNHHARRLAIGKFQQIISEDASLAIPLTRAFFFLLHNTNTPTDEKITPSIYSHVLYRISSKAPVEIIPLIAFLAHDPLVRTSESNPSLVWDQLVARWKRGSGVAKKKKAKKPKDGKEDGEEDGEEEKEDDAEEEAPDAINAHQALLHNPQQLQELLLGPQGLLSPSPRARDAATEVIVSLFRKYPDVVEQHLLTGLLSLASPKALLNASEYELAVFATPDGQLCDWKPKGEFQAQVVESKNVARSKTQKKLYGADDEWDRQVKAELAKKKGPAGKKDEGDGGNAAKLAEEKQIRESLKALIQQVESICKVFVRAEAAATNTRILLLQQVLPSLHQLLRCPLTDQSARRAHSGLSRCLDDSVRGVGSTLAIAVQHAVIQQVKAFEDDDNNLLFDFALTRASELCQERRMGPATFAYVAPLLSLVINQSRDGEEQEHKEKEKDDDEEEEAEQQSPDLYRAGLEPALNILAGHCAREVITAAGDSGEKGTYPTHDLLLLLLHALAHINRLGGSCQEALVQLGASLTALELPTLLSDQGSLHPDATVRLSCFQAVGEVDFSEAGPAPDVIARLHIGCHDSDQLVSEAADSVWEKLQLSIREDYAQGLIPLLSHNSGDVRYFASMALAEGMSKHPDGVQDLVQELIQLFNKSPDEVIESKFGLRQEKEYIYRWTTRHGIALVLTAGVPSFSEGDILRDLFQFLLDSALRDTNEEVWGQMLEGGLKIIEAHGKEQIDTLIPIFEKYLAQLKNTKSNELGLPAKIADKLRVGVVVFLGTVARYMDPESPKVVQVVDHLIELVLHTPSASVQRAVAECLPPLMPPIKDHADKVIKLLLTTLSQGEYGQRKGASYGIASAVKGLKLSALKKYNILETLTAYATDSKSAPSREGAMMCYERLFAELGSKFEPYVVQILPHLLACFGDNAKDVRLATQVASQMIMSHLTGHGVKMVLPVVLGALAEDKPWRTKLESIGLLGAMAYCAPQQLSACLPMIVPRLLEVMADPHPKVQEASKKALRQIGSVIKNPEIKKLENVLLAALSDPNDATTNALKELMRTSFVHSVDPPSLALIVPILRRGLKSRTPLTKKMAAQVVGSMCSLISDVKDMVPYAQTILKYLKQILVDPNPDVRTVAAKALGALYKGIGDDEQFVGLYDYLMETLKGETTNVQRSGAAQGLAQILACQGEEKTTSVLPEICTLAKTDQNQLVREAFMGVFLYLPEALGDGFSQYLPDVFACVLDGLADEIGPVREVALAAGQELVMKYAVTQTELLLPALMQGIINDNWRIRLSSLQLLGCLLLRLAGFSGKLFMDEADLENKESLVNIGKKEEQMIEDALGTEQRDNVLANIYLMQSDVLHNVKQMAWRVWKAVVANTPRMLATVLPKLMSKVIADLASNNQEPREAAAAALGDLVTRMGDTVLQQIIPILQEELTSPEPTSRVGVCYGLSEVMANAKKSHITAYMVDLIPAVRDALCDEEEEVREAAGQAFQTLYRNVGQKAIDEIVPSLLEQYDAMEESEEESSLALRGLKQVLSICDDDALSYVVPHLIEEPITASHARALEALADAFGEGFQPYVKEVITAVVNASANPETKLPEIEAAAKSVVLNLTEESVSTLVEVLTDRLKNDTNPEVRLVCANLIGDFCAGTKCSIEKDLAVLMQQLLATFVDKDPRLQEAGANALGRALEVVDKEKLITKIQLLRQCVSNMTRDLTGRRVLDEVPGFSIKKGLEAILPMLQHGLMHGPPAIREHAASGLGDVIELTNPTALAPHVIKITGPLIRIVGDRFPPLVKAAILNTLGLLLNKSGQSLKPFLPQLQTTFVKALHDPAQEVRDRAASGLGQLMTLSKRVDPVVTDLITNAREEQNAGLQASMVQALGNVMSDNEMASKLSPDLFQTANSLALSFLASNKDAIRRESARLYGVLQQFTQPDQLPQAFKAILSGASEWRGRDGQLLALSSALAACPPTHFDGSLESQILGFAAKHLQDDNVNVVCSAIRVCVALAAHAARTKNEGLCARALKEALTLGNSDTAQVRQFLFEQLAEWCKAYPEMCEESLKGIVLVCLARQHDVSALIKRGSQEVLYYAFQFHISQEQANKVLTKFCQKNKDKEIQEAFLYVKNTISKMVITTPVPSIVMSSEEPEDDDDDQGDDIVYD